MNSYKKDGSLEALRGVAAFFVIFWHIGLAFFPEFVSVPSRPDVTWSAANQIWFVVLNGASSVQFFFVLSGFVLTRRFFLTDDMSIIIRGAIKRWPRLIGPVLLGVLGSWFLFWTGAYAYVETGKLTGAGWLSTFGNAFHSGVRSHITLWHALAQGIFSVFFREETYFISDLWSMRSELIGSYVGFGLALFLGATRGKIVPGIFILTITFIMTSYLSWLMIAFPAGVALAWALPRKPQPLSILSLIPLLTVGLYLLGYSQGARGAFTPISMLVDGRVPYTFVTTVGACLLIFVVEACPAMRIALSGRWALFLGSISFPIYIVHVPILASLGAHFYLWYADGRSSAGAGFLAGAVTVVGAVIVAYPLAIFDRRWTKFVNRVTARVLADPGQPALSARQSFDEGGAATGTV
ncbi:Peptidoglycan/LPS O-acetylase OafA/YrhL, contains acyltransferase and SGNH-hydrolase domains [Faunimonas pinastri]|uniref:Peptidoglycan/LPS O-acetylase OafA/YrhL, contains acyltransferase and SGNH-hydrolase domains n=1 Tax=Faunimonas pinastri TaxID=1855383 RepID=A0A1H8Z8Q1_9HYPH|nr:acyltransferase [Faunimonas pinastri]SEP60647.1 Peptidoglycan/LPS O-acetylase OafA/YrhL, contains acyltransferase and SGNH-hydrolase domains [Faunimonas pinastri]